MKHDATEHDEAGRPDNFEVGLQEMAVGIDLVRADENLQIASQMPDDKKNIMPPVAAMTYFLPSEEQNRLRNKLIMFAWRDQIKELHDFICEAGQSQRICGAGIMY